MAPKTKATGHFTASINETIDYLEEVLVDVEDGAEKSGMITEHATMLSRSMAS